MNVNKAKQLKDGDIVACPVDMGQNAFRGKVVGTYQSALVSTNLKGIEYIWVTVDEGHNKKSVWPSNRLG